MKRLLFLVLVLCLMAMPLVACSQEDTTAGSGTAHTLRVWASADDQALTRQLADMFIEANPQYTVTIELSVVGEPDAWSTFSQDPGSAAHVFAFPNDQLRDFVNAGGLSAVTRNRDNIIARNVDGSVGSATLDGTLWAYPMTADNGYFLYYDSSILSAEDVKTLDRILEVAYNADRRVLMHLDNNGWYVASFFLGAGNTISIDENGNQVVDFNNATGLAAAQAMLAFTSHPAYLNGNDDVLLGGMGTTIAAGVSGTWNAAALQEILGENYAAAKLPTFTMNGQQVQMGSFGGYKLIGINSMITDPELLAIAQDFADFITNEQAQIMRFEQREMGPSNINAAASPAVQANIALAALAAQSAYATSQNDVLGSYWGPAGAFGTEMVNRSTTDLQTLLDAMVAQIMG